MIEPHGEPYTLEEKNGIASYLGELDRFAKAAIVTQGIVHVFKATGKPNLPGIEEILREMGSRTFLMGRDIAFLPEFDTFLPCTSRKGLPYYLWVEVNFETGARRILQEEGINVAQNFVRLGETGFITPKIGTELSRSLRADRN